MDIAACGRARFDPMSLPWRENAAGRLAQRSA
jgi:hypothetical protein